MKFSIGKSSEYSALIGYHRYLKGDSFPLFEIVFLGLVVRAWN